MRSSSLFVLAKIRSREFVDERGRRNLDNLRGRQQVSSRTSTFAEPHADNKSRRSRSLPKSRSPPTTSSLVEVSLQEPLLTKDPARQRFLEGGHSCPRIPRQTAGRKQFRYTAQRFLVTAGRTAINCDTAGRTAINCDNDCQEQLSKIVGQRLSGGGVVHERGRRNSSS